MNDVNIGKDNSRHSFVFTGKGGEYFLICLVNFLLTIITLGIYGPWALIKCRRYIYQHVKWFTEFGHLNRGDMLTSEQHRCHNEKKKFQRRV